MFLNWGLGATKLYLIQHLFQKFYISEYMQYLY